MPARIRRQNKATSAENLLQGCDQNQNVNQLRRSFSFLTPRVSERLSLSYQIKVLFVLFEKATVCVTAADAGNELPGNWIFYPRER